MMPNLNISQKCRMLLPVFILLLIALKVTGQGEENIWMSSHSPFGGSRFGLRFTPSGPETFIYNAPPRSLMVANNSVCDPSGNLLFYTSGVSKKVYDTAGNSMPNGTELAYPIVGTDYSMPPVITEKPGIVGGYYIFHIKNGGVFYSTVDMGMNGGLGDLPEKNIGLNNFGGTAAVATYGKMTAAQGCENIWLITRSKNVNQYRAYAVSESGVDTAAVISEVGLFPVSYYQGDAYSGKIKMSPDQTMMAATCSKVYNTLGTAFPGGPKGGIELYTFEKCSGRITNPVIIDNSQYYEGICFSQDNTKLYASSFDKVYQFDVSLPTTSAITASKILVLENTPIPYYNIWCGYYCDTLYQEIGDLKRGPDGKIYMGNNRPCKPNALPVADISRYHRINNPNLSGLLCGPELDAVSFNPGCYLTGIDLPPDFVKAPSGIDTLVGTTFTLNHCFTDTALIKGNPEGSCFMWEDGSLLKERLVTGSGPYIAGYFLNDCTFRIDTFKVNYISLPKLNAAAFACPGARNAVAKIGNSGNDQMYSFVWMDENGTVLRHTTNTNKDSIHTLDTGYYAVRITTVTGCDTILSFHIQSLPLPVASFESDTVVCNNTPLPFFNTSLAPLSHWDFGDGYIASEQHPTHSFLSGGKYNVALVVKNIEGCTDTATRVISVRQLLLKLKSSHTIAEKGTRITLSTSAPEPYTIQSWEPQSYFSLQSALTQHFELNKTEMFRVSGKSDTLGCNASDTVTVKIETHALMPNAFSPNGDGLNDRFVPVILGDDYKIISFSIFNRWGQAVFLAHGVAAEKGWDGTLNGEQLDIGTYFYQIEIATASGNISVRKGDVSLIR